MPVESLLIGLVAVAVILVILALVPAGRRLLATVIDIVDGSVALFAIRRVFGLDTTTARQRRIDERHAREQAEILRRIGATQGTDATAAADAALAGTAAAVPLGVVASTPNRLVVSGEPSFAERPPAPPRPERRALLRDGAMAAIGLVAVVVAVAAIGSRPTGAVLGASATPAERVGVAPTSPDARGTPVGTPTGTPAGTPATTAPSASAPARAASPTPSAAPATPTPVSGPVVTDARARLAGATGGGPTVAVRLSWDVPDTSVAPKSFDVMVQVDDRAEERVASVAGDVRSLPVTIGVGRTSTFSIRGTGSDGSAGPAVEWAPITPGRHQEGSSLVTRRGAWRGASGPSLSGGGVTFSRAAGASLSFRFSGTDVEWIGTLTPFSGKAQVRVDGDLVDTVDLRDADVTYRRVIFRRHVDDGPHVLDIRALGAGRVDVDAFVVLR